jgi:hypothetical protein
MELNKSWDKASSLPSSLNLQSENMPNLQMCRRSVIAYTDKVLQQLSFASVDVGRNRENGEIFFACWAA